MEWAKNPLIEIADALASGILVKDITFIPGTVYKTKDIEGVYDSIELPSYDVMKKEPKEYAKSFHIQYQSTDPFTGKTLIRTLSQRYLCGSESAAAASDDGRDGRGLWLALHEDISSFL